MRYDRNSQRIRRGTTAVQVALLLGVIALVAIPSIAALGRATSSYLNETSAGVADPSKLTGRFGGGSSADGSGGGGDSGDASPGGGNSESGSDAGSGESDSGDSGSGDSGGAPAPGKKKKKSGKRK